MACTPPSSSVIPPHFGGSQAVLPVAPTKYSTPGGSAKTYKRTVSERTREDVPNGRRQPSHTCLTLELAVCEQSPLSLRERNGLRGRQRVPDADPQSRTYPEDWRPSTERAADQGGEDTG